MATRRRFTTGAFFYMDLTYLLSWIVGISTLSSLFVSITRFRIKPRAWIIINCAILALIALGWALKSPIPTRIAAGAWFLFVVTPGFLAKSFNKLLLQQRYDAAHKIARLIAALHPFSGWRDQVKLMNALRLAHRGDLSRAIEILEAAHQSAADGGLIIKLHLYRLTSRWEDLLAMLKTDAGAAAMSPQIVPTLLRGLAETGDLAGMVRAYEENKNQIARLVPVSTRDLCRLVLFAFCGRRDVVERLFASSLSILPLDTREFWLATADLAVGREETARSTLLRLKKSGDASLQPALDRRLAFPLGNPSSLPVSAAETITAAALEFSHDRVFDTQPALLSKRSWVVVLLLVANLCVYALEVIKGGATNGETLSRLGAMYPPAVRHGEYWRVPASLFLHFGPAHLFMNLFALAGLGPFVQLALGGWRFLVVYFTAGIGSMLLIVALATGAAQNRITVGASGAILGIVGATAALMLRGWWCQRAVPARRRLFAIITILAIQTIFDYVTPQVSMTAHLSGATLGFLVTLFLRDRLNPAAARQ